jgi:hypothetical protein
MPHFAPSPFRVALLAVAMLASAAIPLAAAPLDLAAVPADAKWLMHVDMDAARDSVVVQRAWERMLKMHPHAGGMMDMVTRMAGMDPRKDLRDATAYGRDTDKRNGVMIVRAKANREFLTRMVEKAADHKTMKHGDYTLHAWTHKRGRHSGPVVGAFHKDDVMVFARTEAAVTAALDVLDGRQAAVTGDAPLAGRVRPGSIVVARATAVDPDTKCPVLKQGKGFRVAMGEHEGKSFYRARLEMASPAAADDVVDVVKGFTALASLRWGGEADAMKLVDAAKTVVEGDTCTISWDADADEVWKVVERAADAWEKRHRGRHGAGGCPACGKDGCGGCGKGECPVMKGGKAEAEKPLRDDEF